MTPPGALRILARDNDRQILVLHGVDRAIGSDERLAWIEWFSSPAIAEEVSRFCSNALRTGGFPPDADGWHGFPVQHWKTVRALAGTHLNLDLRQKADAPREQQAWTRERDNWLCFLAGQGHSGKAIANDELIRSTPNNVYVRAHRLGISISAVRSGQLSIRLPATALATMEVEANRAHLTREAFARKLLIRAIEAHASDQGKASILQGSAPSDVRTPISLASGE